MKWLLKYRIDKLRIRRAGIQARAAALLSHEKATQSSSVYHMQIGMKLAQTNAELTELIKQLEKLSDATS